MPRSSARPLRARLRSDMTLRAGTPADAEALHALITAHQAEGHLLPRRLAELSARAGRFVVCEVEGVVRACAELAPLSGSLAEVRSLVVSREIRRTGAATRLLAALRQRALDDGYEALCAFTHDARFFVRQNFSMVPHQWLPDKIAKDCATCPLFRRCGQYAMVMQLKETVRYGVDDVEDRRVAVA